ncbi:MAG: M20 family metallopeptidase [Anaerolineales bacterium]|nr:M20 family metallopeptidase [Anaerolineales bacterium]MCX7755615.1 M20 family metallopeptidase [Anaerolineales bacterium]MDW8276602.1 M20 family metallopeptidase [Anaerolineales bacterium]
MPDFTARLPAMLTLLQRLVETESPSNDKAAVDRVGALVLEECHRLEAQVEIVENAETGNHLVARWNAHLPGQPILLLHHMDTVFPLGMLARMPFYTRDGKTYGPGVLDMKGGIVITLAAIEALRDAGQLNRPVTALFTSDEEIGSHTSRALIEQLAAKSALALVMESGLESGAIKVWRKGVGDFVVRVRGRAAHSGGEHEKGRSAIRELAHQILEIEKLTDYRLGTTVNVGVIRGGTVTNVVPEEAVAEGDIRILVPEEARRIEAALKALKPAFPDTQVDVTVTFNRPPLPFNERNRAAFAQAQAIAAAEGLPLEAGGSGGGSDGNFIAPLGVPVLDGLGAVGADYHSEREWIYTESLATRARLVAALLREWG